MASGLLGVLAAACAAAPRSAPGPRPAPALLDEVPEPAAAAGLLGHAAPAAPRGADAAVDSLGQPAWLRRGSAAIQVGGTRTFFGVGSAAAEVGQVARQRAASDGRARAEVARQVGQVAGALADAHNRGDDAHEVARARDGTSRMALQQVQVVDRYSAADGTLYSLAALDAAALEPALAATAARGLVHGQAAAADLPARFDALSPAPPEPSPPPPPALLPAGPAPTLGPQAQVKAAAVATTAGPVPAWVNGEDPRFAPSQCLCAVGAAADRDAADRAGYAALARIFSAEVRASARDFVAASSRSGAPPVEQATADSLTEITTEALLEGARIAAAHADQGATYALACLPRTAAATTLRSRMAALDAEAAAILAGAADLDRAARTVALARALAVVLRREALNAELRIVDPRGVGLAGPYAPGDLAVARAAAVAALAVGIRVQGPDGDAFAAALAEALTSHGYRLVAGDQPLDVLITATLKVSPAGTLPAGQVLARAEAALEAKNVAQDRIMVALQGSRKDGGADLASAARRALSGLAGQLAAEVGARVDAALAGR